jgi:hypothetical protein
MWLPVVMQGVLKEWHYKCDVWRVLRRRLHFKAYKLSIVWGVDSLYAFKCKRLDYQCGALFWNAMYSCHYFSILVLSLKLTGSTMHITFTTYKDGTLKILGFTVVNHCREFSSWMSTPYGLRQPVLPDNTVHIHAVLASKEWTDIKQILLLARCVPSRQ